MKQGADRVLSSQGNDPARTAVERSGLYGFLTVIYRQEPTAALLHRMRDPHVRKALAAAGVAPDTDPPDRPENDLIEDLAVEYTRLFIGPGNHIPPYASVHLWGEGGSLWGASTAWVKRFIETAGFEYRPDYHDLPDHIGVELEFMHEVAAREARAFEEEDEAELATLRQTQREFVGKHLALWVPAFCEEVMARAELPFYGEIAKLTRDFVSSEAEELARGGDEAAR